MKKYLYIIYSLLQMIAVIIIALIITACTNLNSASSMNADVSTKIANSSVQNIRNNTIQKTVEWFTTGKIDPNILANDFLFKSPYYKDKNKSAFVEEFNDTDFYQKQVLAKIKKFDPLVVLQSADGKYFAIVTEYHTYSGHNVYETVFGKLNTAGLLIELRSIYDLKETKEAFHL